MFTRAIHSRMIALAGPDFAWDNGVPGWRLSATPRNGLRVVMFEFQNGECFSCGIRMEFEATEFCHIVSRGPAKKGWTAGNIALGCKRCNVTQAFNGPIVPFNEIRANLVMTEWPPMTFLRDKGIEFRAA